MFVVDPIHLWGVSLARVSRAGKLWAVLSHLALNSSKDSSWCSDRRRDEVLKVGRATIRGRATAGRRVVARKKEVAGPRAAIRRRDIFFLLVCSAAAGLRDRGKTDLKREKEEKGRGIG